MQIAVIGMHRSGTSVLARLLNLLGIYFAPEGMGTGANQENPKGFWERRDVRALNDHVLHSVGCDWNRVSRLDLDAIPAPLAAEFEKRAAQIVLSMDANRPWFMKEPRLCLLLPLWKRVLEAPVCIHILRHPVEVASSLKTRNGIPFPAGLALWEYYNRSALASMRDLPRVTVGHRDLIQRPAETLSSIQGKLESLGVGRLTFPSNREIESFVSGELYREREGERGLDAFSGSPQIKLFERWLSEKSEPKAGKAQSRDGLKALGEYEAGLPPLNVAAPPKKPTESELKAQIASRERDMELLEGQLAAAKSELGQRDLRLAFLEGEFIAFRESASSREQSAGEFVTSLRQMLVEREAWLQDREKAAEADRVRLQNEIERMSERLESVRQASAVAEREFSLKEIGFAEERKDLQQRLSSESERLFEMERRSTSMLAQMEATAKADAEESQREWKKVSEERSLLAMELQEATSALENSREEVASLSSKLDEAVLRISRLEEEKNELSDSLQEALSRLGQAHEEGGRLRIAVEEARAESVNTALAIDTLRTQASERSAEIEQLTRLYLERQGDVDRLVALQARAEVDNASARASFQAKESVLMGDVSMLSKRLGSLEQQLASEQAMAAQAHARARAENLLCRSAIAFYGNEIDRMDSMMSSLRSSSSWKAMATARRLRAWLGGGNAAGGHELGSVVALLRQSRWFDADWYVAKYDDVVPSGLAPEVHFLVHGGPEGRDPSPEFDARFYLESNPDVSASGQNPLLHFIRHGEAEGRPAKSVAD